MTYSRFPQSWTGSIAIQTRVIPHDMQNMTEKIGGLARSRTDQEVGGPFAQDVELGIWRKWEIGRNAGIANGSINWVCLNLILTSLDGKHFPTPPARRARQIMSLGEVEELISCVDPNSLPN